jgi:hypothetical protein
MIGSIEPVQLLRSDRSLAVPRAGQIEHKVEAKHEAPPSPFPLSGVEDSELVFDDDPGNSSPQKSLSMPLSLKRAMLMHQAGSGLVRSSTRTHGWEDYSLRIVTAGAITTNGSGIVANTFAADPTVLSISEWSTFASVFDEVKLQSFSLYLAPYNTGSTSSSVTSIAVGSFLNKGSIPSTILSVLVAPDGHLVSPYMVKPDKTTLNPGQLGFAPTTTPAGTTAYGCPGYIHLYATGANSVGIMTYMIEARYHLRGRM